MNEKYLIIAEANKIQDLIFRSSQLKQIIGGSEILVDFCEKVGSLIHNEYQGEKIVAAGGLFVAIFPNEENASNFIRILEELYRRKLGGKISITRESLPISDSSSENDVLKDAFNKINQMKHRGLNPSSPIHIPYFMFCESCGISIANKLYCESLGNAFYCSSCYNKTITKKKTSHRFINNIQIDENYKFQTDVDIFATISDPKKYVAYLIADGNNMGSIVGSQETFNDLTRFSDGLSQILYECLKAPIKELIQNEKFVNKKTLPILPLIIGGDDLFCLLPARWAIDFTKIFILNYERKMKNLLQKIRRINHITTPTMSAGIVICKNTFPYKMAYEIGEELLSQAKIRSKTGKSKESTISIALIKNNTFGKSKSDEIFQLEYPAFDLHQIELLFESRNNLQILSNKKRTELMKIFQEAQQCKDIEELMENWIKKIDKFLDRLPNLKRKVVEENLKGLLIKPHSSAQYWEQLDDGNFYNPVVVLFNIWDYYLKLNQTGDENEEEFR